MPALPHTSLPPFKQACNHSHKPFYPLPAACPQPQLPLHSPAHLHQQQLLSRSQLRSPLHLLQQYPQQQPLPPSMHVYGTTPLTDTHPLLVPHQQFWQQQQPQQQLLQGLALQGGLSAGDLLQQQQVCAGHASTWACLHALAGLGHSQGPLQQLGQDRACRALQACAAPGPAMHQAWKSDIATDH